MKRIALFLCLLSARTLIASPDSSVTIAIEPKTSRPIPPDFVGLSFGMKSLLPDSHGNHFFSPANHSLVTLFRNLGISHLRVGGTTVESPPATPIPDHADIDSLFAFAEAAGVKKIIYSFRLLETNSALHYDLTNAALAKYIWDHHRDQLDCFALGNEPDLQRVFKQDYEVRDFDTYLAKWRRFAALITNAVPGAKFTGPDGGSGNVKWTTAFAKKLKDSGDIKLISEHFYVGGAGRDIAAAQGIDDMLSPRWDKTNLNLYHKMAEPILAQSLPYRFTEANDHYSGGVKDASDTFAGALWALDFLHWWAAHDASGVDFHNTQWVVNDVITLDSDHEPAPNPKAYGLKAFELGSHGSPQITKITNPSGINLTVYAVHSTTEDFVTLINKEHGPAARAITVTIFLLRKTKQAEVTCLTAPDNNPAAKTGVTLGGAAIDHEKPWRGEWKPLSIDNAGFVLVPLPPASAAIVRFYSP